MFQTDKLNDTEMTDFMAGVGYQATASIRSPFCQNMKVCAKIYFYMPTGCFRKSNTMVSVISLLLRKLNQTVLTFLTWPVHVVVLEILLTFISYQLD